MKMLISANFQNHTSISLLNPFVLPLSNYVWLSNYCFLSAWVSLIRSFIQSVNCLRLYSPLQGISWKYPRYPKPGCFSFFAHQTILLDHYFTKIVKEVGLSSQNPPFTAPQSRIFCSPLPGLLIFWSFILSGLTRWEHSVPESFQTIREQRTWETSWLSSRENNGP